EIDFELMAKPRHLVDQRDIYVAIGVFKELGHFGLTGALCTNHSVNEPRIECFCCIGAFGRMTTDHLGRVLGTELLVAGIYALRRKNQAEVLPGYQSPSFKDRPDLLF